jgi:hypothetical protein
MKMDQPTATQAAVATAASIQALAEALHANCAPAAASHRLVLSSFWKEDPVGWFQYAEAEFAISDFPADSYLCYSQRWAAQHVFQVRNTQFHSFIIVVRKTQSRSISNFVSALCAMTQLRILPLRTITVGKNK